MDAAQILAQQSEIARRRKLLDVLAQQNMATPITGGGRWNAIGQALAKLGSAAIQGIGNKQLADSEEANRGAYSNLLRQEMDNYLDTSQGRAAMPDPREASGMGPAGMGGSMAGESQAVAGIKANPREAILRAMTSQLPEMQNLGRAAMTEFGRQKEAKPIEVNGQLVDPTTFKVIGDFRDKPESEQWEPTTIAGPDGRPLAAQRNKATGKIDILDKGVKVNVDSKTFNAAQNQGLAEWSKLAAKTVDELSSQARGSVKMLSQLNQMEKLTQSGTLTGPTANAGIWLGQLVRSAGGSLPPDTAAALQNSETFGNVATEVWMQMMNSVGGARGLVKEESERIAANLPSLVQTPEGRKQIIQVMRQAAVQSVADAKRAQAEYGKAVRAQNPELFTYGLGETQIPNTMPTQPGPGTVAPGGGQGSPISLEEYLRRLQGR